MGLKQLLEESKARAPKMKSQGDDGPRLHIIDMSKKGYTNAAGEAIPSNRGTIKFIPILSLNDQEVKYAYDVRCYLYEDEDRLRQYRVMDPKDYERKLSDDEKALITELRSRIDYFKENINGYPDADVKSYALMFGYVLEHISEDGTTIIDKGNRTAALIVFPSKNFSKAMTSCLEDLNSLGEDMAEEFYSALFNREIERSSFLTVQFSRGSSFGYDVTVATKSLDPFCKNMLTPEELKAMKIIIPQEELDFCTYQSAIFFAGNYKDDDDFDFDYAKKVNGQIVKIINGAEEEETKAEKLPPLPNKNRKGKSDLDE